MNHKLNKKQKEKLIFLFIIVISGSELKAQCEICGVYKGNTRQRFQELRINADSTFEYQYENSRATLMGATTTGKWKIVGNQIELNSKYNNEEFEVYTKKIDLCKNIPNYLNKVCDDLVKIQVVNLEGEYIWFLKSIMINGDTSKISAIVFEDVNNVDEASPMSCFFKAESIKQIDIFNGFYNELVITINNPNVNYVKIKGNFADVLWYTYIKKEKWRIKKNKLVSNKRFGKLIKK